MNKTVFPLLLTFCAATSCVVELQAGDSDQADPLAPSTAFPLADGDYVERLDKVIVTGTVDPKTTFDLAQGASSLSGKSLLLQQEATLGETLSKTPGVNSTYYGPGASRPIIRGLGGDRVRMLQDSIGSLDLSSISPDHNVSVEPLLLERVEVLRGPATLLYGSSAVGGVVNVVDNRIPNEAPAAPVAGKLEARLDTAAAERSGVVSLLGGDSDFGLQVSGVRTRTDDVKIPGVAQQGPDAPQNQAAGTLPSSAVSTKSGSVGGTWFARGGTLGLSAGVYDTDYGVPTGDIPPTSIDMKQRRFDLRGSAISPVDSIKELHVRIGYGDYTHRELSGGTKVNTAFANQAWEGRLEMIQEKIGELSGTVGLQVSRDNSSAAGAEVVTPATLTHNAAVFALEEYKFERVNLQLGGRCEWQSIDLGEVAAGLPSFDGYNARSGEKRSDQGVSVSTGAVFYPSKLYSVALSLAASQRLPSAQELYSNGPHGGTAAYEVGRSDLAKEDSLGVDLTVRRRGDRVTGSAGIFLNQFNGYIYEQRLPDDQKPVANNPDGLAAYQFVARDALFYGGEMEMELHLIDEAKERLHLSLDADYVHAEETTDHVPLPRIPPMRVGSELRYERGNWTLGTDYRYVFRQGRVSRQESETAGYALLGADIGYDFFLGRTRYELFLRGTNLADRAARVHTSFLKDYAPLPGRDMTAGVRMNF